MKISHFNIALLCLTVDSFLPVKSFLFPAVKPSIKQPVENKVLNLRKLYKRNEVSDIILEERYAMKEQAIDVAQKSIVTVMLSFMFLFPNMCVADEIGRETEAPTLFTGESVMICTKRGPLGACLKTEARTTENDNDKADQYFSKVISEREISSVARGTNVASSEENELLKNLLKQTEENKERNAKLVRQKSIQNGMGASFGPFSKQVAILNLDGDTYTLLENPQAMRLKKAGYIKDRKFVKQPSKEVIDAALESDSPNFIESFKGILGGDD